MQPLFKIHPSIKESWILDKPHYLYWLCDLLILAEREEVEGRSRWFVKMTVRNLSERWQYLNESNKVIKPSAMKVSRFLNLLKEKGIVTVTKTVTSIEILNYNDYQLINDSKKSETVTRTVTKENPTVTRTVTETVTKNGVVTDNKSTDCKDKKSETVTRTVTETVTSEDFTTKEKKESPIPPFKENKKNIYINAHTRDILPLSSNSDEENNNNHPLPPPTLKERVQEFYNSLIPFVKRYDKVMVRAFYDYWSEAHGDYMKWEMNPKFTLITALDDWYRNGQPTETEAFEEFVEDEYNFDRVWDLYDKKQGPKDRLRAKWNKLSKEVRKKIFEYIPRYKEAQPDKQYRKNFETFLNQKGWEDELITSKDRIHGTNQENDPYAKRRRIEVTATSPEDYKTGF